MLQYSLSPSAIHARIRRIRRIKRENNGEEGGGRSRGVGGWGAISGRVGGDLIYISFN